MTDPDPTPPAGGRWEGYTGRKPMPPAEPPPAEPESDGDGRALGCMAVLALKALLIGFAIFRDREDNAPPPQPVFVPNFKMPAPQPFDPFRGLKLPGTVPVPAADELREVPGTPADIDRELKAGRQAAYQGRWTQAVDAYRRAAEFTPRSGAALAELGYALGRTGEPAAGLSYAWAATEAAPADPVVRGRLVQLLLAAGDLEDATGRAGGLAADFPADPTALHAAAEAAAAGGRFGEAADTAYAAYKAARGTPAALPRGQLTQLAGWAARASADDGSYRTLAFSALSAEARLWRAAISRTVGAAGRFGSAGVVMRHLRWVCAGDR